MGLEVLFSRWLIYMAVHLALDVGKRTPVPLVWTSPYSFLSVLTARRLSFLRERNPGEKGGCHNPFYDLGYVKSHAISPPHSICYKKVTRSSSIQKEKNPFLLFQGQGGGGNAKDFVDVFLNPLW